MFLKVEPVAQTFNSRFYRVYRGFLLGLVRHPVLSLLVVIAVFLFSLQGMKYVPNIFFPPSDTAMFWAKSSLRSEPRLRETRRSFTKSKSS